VSGAIQRASPHQDKDAVAVQNEARELVAPDFLALTIGIVVFFVGVLITRRVEFLGRYSIPEPVTGGFVAALPFCAAHPLLLVDVGFDMETRDRLLVVFFATVGLNARLADLATGGRVLGMLCLATVAIRVPAGHPSVPSPP
jgi:ESS family glutamate:Na+ symporter